MTENFYLIGLVACFLWGIYLIWRNRKIIKNFKAASELTNSSMKGLIENIERLEEENKALKLLTESPASENTKNVDWEPDNYKDLSEGKYERFSDDDLDEFKKPTTKQLKSIGG